jgi:hypothetical protein
MPDLVITRQTLNLEKVIADKNPNLLKILPKYLLRYLKRVIHVDEMNEGLWGLRDKFGLDFVKAVLEIFQVKTQVEGLENMSQEGRYIVVANHPLGGLDGMALICVVGRVSAEIVVPVNDILMNVPNVRELLTNMDPI